MAFSLFKGIAGILGGLWHFLFESFTHYDQVVGDVTDILETSKAIKSNVETEIAQLRAFKFDPKWSNRVINVPRAVAAIQDLKVTILDDFRGRLDTLIEPVHEFVLIFKTEHIEQGDPQQAVSALAKAEVKLGEVVTLISQIKTALHTISDFVALFDRLRNDLETLEELFLPQGNLRRVERLEAGGKIKIRLGNLHS